MEHGAGESKSIEVKRQKKQMGIPKRRRERGGRDKVGAEEN